MIKIIKMVRAFNEFFKSTKKLNSNSFFSFVLSFDFQEPASVTAEGLAIFNNNLLFLIINIVIFVAWILMLICFNFFDETSSKKTDFTHSNNIEIIWTMIPSLLLIILASPSFALLYSLEEVSTPEITCKITAHQWYWTYEIAEFRKYSDYTCSFSSYGVSDEYLKKPDNIGLFRLMEVTKRLILPSNTCIRLLVTSADVLHSWAVPSFQIKIDACPGRLNETNLFIKNIGIYYGLCSEICGVNHAYMPIVVLSCSSDQFYNLASNIDFVLSPSPHGDDEEDVYDATKALNSWIPDIHNDWDRKFAIYYFAFCFLIVSNADHIYLIGSILYRKFF